MDPHIFVTLFSDQPLTHLAVESLLTQQEDITLTVEASPHQVSAGPAKEPHIALLTIDGADSESTMDAILEDYPNVRIILLIEHERDSYLHWLLIDRVAGCFFKEDLNGSFTHIIRAVAAGEALYARGVVEKMLTVQNASQAMNIDYATLDLTLREQEVLKLMACNLTNREIAAELSLSRQTVRNKATRIYEKVGVHSRAALLAWVQRQRIVS